MTLLRLLAGSPLHAQEILEGETHGSSHFNPGYEAALVAFVREHNPGN